MKLFLTFHYQEHEEYVSWLDADWVTRKELAKYEPHAWKRYVQYYLFSHHDFPVKDRSMESWRKFSEGKKCIN